MQIISCSNYDQLSQKLANQIAQEVKHLLKMRKKCVLVVPTGSSPRGLYEALIPLLKDVDLANLHIVSLDEYYPMKKTSPHSYFQEIYTLLLEPLHRANPTFRFDHAYIPNGEAPDPFKECEQFDQKIYRLGGLDIVVLGLGVNGHIAFNEPGSRLEETTRLVQIAQSTKQSNSRFFEHKDEVPKRAITLGLKTIVSAQNIYVIVTGESKNTIINKIMNLAEPTSAIPASYLLHHKSVFWYINEHDIHLKTALA
ncbi:glucosamine-6-phosphate deaminase [Candidatus Woesebacteria bacterium]|nr:glucosamine-6-phosphate deaminase [Candidatus Woesebacteria bacterium]